MRRLRMLAVAGALTALMAVPSLASAQQAPWQCVREVAREYQITPRQRMDRSFDLRAHMADYQEALLDCYR